MNPLAALLQPLTTVATKVLDRFIPDPTQRAEAIMEMQRLLISEKATELKVARDIIVAEAKSGSWLTQNWRPITMLWFAGLVGAHWLGYTPENLPEEQVEKLLDIVQIGIGGYVVGRSAEKVLPKVAEVFKNR